MIRLSTVLLASFLIAAPVNADTVSNILGNASEDKCNEFDSYYEGYCNGMVIGILTGMGNRACIAIHTDLMLTGQLNNEYNILECTDIVDRFLESEPEPRYNTMIKSGDFNVILDGLIRAMEAYIGDVLSD